MKYNESNFTYIKVTSLSKYYPDLSKAECACEDFPRMTKIIIRKVLESFIIFSRNIPLFLNESAFIKSPYIIILHI